MGIHVISVSRGVDFIGTTVGLAKVSAACSRHSGAVNQVKGTLTQVCQTVYIVRSKVEPELWGRSVSLGP